MFARPFRFVPFALLLVPCASHGLSFSYEFNKFLTGASNYNWSLNPIGKMTIADSGPNSVLFTLEMYNNSLSGDQFISALWFGMDPFYSDVVQTNQTPANKFDGGITYDEDSYNIGAGYKFDLEVRQLFQTSSNNSGEFRLGEGDTVSFRLSRVAGLSAMNFTSVANGNSGLIHGAIHLQGLEGLNADSVKLGGLDDNNDGSGDPVPEPASMAMATFMGIAALSRFRKKKSV